MLQILGAAADSDLSNPGDTRYLPLQGTAGADGGSEMSDEREKKQKPANDSLFVSPNIELIEVPRPLTAEQQRMGREQRKIESRVCVIAATPKGAS